MVKKITQICFVTICFVLLSTIGVMAATILPEGYYYLRNVNSNLYLNCAGTEVGSNIRQYDSTQWFLPNKFLLQNDEDGYCVLAPSQAKDKVLNVVDGSTANGANVNINIFDDSSAQKWKFTYNENGSFKIASKCSNDEKVLTVQNASVASGYNVFQFQYNASHNDEWFLEAALEDGVYKIRNVETGLFLTHMGPYLKLSSESNSSAQEFQLSGSTDGYYDIATMVDTNLSLGVVGWDMDNDKEGAYIYTDLGQGSEGQSWRFLVNEDGTYRIVSQLSDCQKAITIKNNYAYSYTYDYDNNAEWELIRVDDITDCYVKADRKIVVDIDTEKYLKENLTPLQLRRWIMRLNLVYDLYADLTGIQPNNGKVITIKADTGWHYEMWSWPDANEVCMNKAYIEDYLMKIRDRDDWIFGVLHEMGHIFDCEGRWNFDDELMANFKMAYVLKQLDGQFTVGIGDYLIYTDYNRIVKYYYGTSNESYLQSLGKEKMKYTNDGLTYLFLDSIGNDWEIIKSAFRKFNSLSESEIPTTRVGKYKKFLEFTDNCNGHTDKYSNEHNFVLQYYGDLHANE